MRGATILKTSDDKTRQLNDHTLMAFSGEAGDTVQFAEYIQANISLYTTRNAHALTPAAVASFTRNELAQALRSRKPYNVNLLLGGVGCHRPREPETEALLDRLPRGVRGAAVRGAWIRAVLLLEYIGQASSSEYRPRDGDEADEDLYDRAEEEVTYRLQGIGGEGDHEGWCQGDGLPGGGKRQSAIACKRS
ncbi:hypothetical protein MRB53_037894 [Persea americana]|nr:hypothetical protein MRB53_037894 [Persea americana]